MSVLQVWYTWQVVLHALQMDVSGIKQYFNAQVPSCNALQVVEALAEVKHRPSRPILAWLNSAILRLGRAFPLKPLLRVSWTLIRLGCFMVESAHRTTIRMMHACDVCFLQPTTSYVTDM